MKINVKPQCVACNVYRSGEQYKFSKYLGNNLAENLHNKSKIITKFTSDELQDMIDSYTAKVKKFL